MKKRVKKKFNKFFSYKKKKGQSNFRGKRSFKYKDFSYADIYSINFKHSDFSFINAEKLKMKFSNLEDCNFTFAEFVNCKFTNVNFLRVFSIGHYS